MCIGHSYLTPSRGVNPFKFLDEFFIPKTRVLVLSVGEDFVILACVIFTQYQRVTDGQTDRRTDIPIVASRGLAATADALQKFSGVSTKCTILTKCKSCSVELDITEQSVKILHSKKSSCKIRFRQWAHQLLVLTCLSVLLHNVANVIKLSKGCRQLIQVIAQCVWRQIRDTSLDDFWEPENQLSKFPLFWTVQLYGGTVGCWLDLCCTDVRCSCNRPEMWNKD